jgi:hypothetical protein
MINAYDSVNEIFYLKQNEHQELPAWKIEGNCRLHKQSHSQLI